MNHKILGFLILILFLLASCATTKNEVMPPQEVETPIVVEAPQEIVIPQAIETSIEVETPKVEETPVVVEAPQEIVIPQVIETPIEVETPKVEETPVVVEAPQEIVIPQEIETPIEVETPKVEETPILVVEAQPVIETPVEEETPVVVETPPEVDDGGLQFQYYDQAIEVESFEDAQMVCLELGDNWRMPSQEELNQLFLLEVFEENYYWSADEKDEDSAYVQYFGTGFQTAFFKDMDFLSVIPVKDN